MAEPGPIQRAICRRITPGMELHTPGRRARFVVERVDGDGLVLLLGAKETPTPFSWECIEGIGAFLSGKGWVVSGMNKGVRKEADPDTLDGHLKGWVNRATANYVARVLEEAGVVELDVGPPLRVRLRPHSDSARKQPA